MSGHMFSRARDFVSTLRQPRIAYRQTHGAESTELAQSHTANADRQSSPDVNQSSGLIPAPSMASVTVRSRFKTQFTGWRFGALHFAAWATIVFLINIICTIWGSVHQKSAGSLSEGDCGRITTLNRGVHIFINVLSTILLSGSNYCMQCLSAPTRADVNRAHATRTWLDIGVPSIRNLKHISRRRLWLWLLLGLSSVPLHLFYNSAVYASISTNSYGVYLVNDAFLADPECRNCTEGYSPYPSITSTASPKILEYLWSLSRKGLLDKLEPAECIAEYATALQSDRRHLLLVMDSSEASSSSVNRNLTFSNNTNMYWTDDFWAEDGTDPYYAPDSYNWICSGLDYKENSRCANRLGEVKQAADTWKVGNFCVGTSGADCSASRWSVRYCLSEPAVPRCKLHFSSVIAAIVTTLNLFKAILMSLVVHFTEDDPLLTMGDAVASFLDEEDPTTSNLSLLSLHDYKSDYNPGAKPWHNQRSRWKDTTSKQRRGVTLALFATALIVIVVLLGRGIRAIRNYANISSTAIFGLGFGAVDTRALIRGEVIPSNMIGLALIANLPQAILSFLYFAYNGMFTAMLLGYEWISYASKQKGLRVSRVPLGFQRSTYFLQLPYRFGIPLVVLSGTLHWLVSQSIFVVSMDRYGQYGTYSGATNMCGYSPIAMLVVVLLGIFMVAAVVGFGYIPYKGGMPLAGSCSLAISAACHPDECLKKDTTPSSEEKLRWGVVSTTADGIGHCAFSCKDVGPLVEGRLYA